MCLQQGQEKQGPRAKTSLSVFFLSNFSKKKKKAKKENALSGFLSIPQIYIYTQVSNLAFFLVSFALHGNKITIKVIYKNGVAVRRRALPGPRIFAVGRFSVTATDTQTSNKYTHTHEKTPSHRPK